LGVLVLLAGHAATLVVGASAEVYTEDSGIHYGITAVHVLLIPIALLALAVLKKVFGCRSSGDSSGTKPCGCTFDGLLFHPILTYLPVAIIAMWIIIHKEFIQDTQPGEIPSCDEENSIFAALYHGKGKMDIENVLFVMVQAIPVVVLMAMALLPVRIPPGLNPEERREKTEERNEQYYELLIVGLAMAFDMVDLQSNVHDDDQKGNHKLVYIILVFSTLSLFQLAQLSYAWRFHFMESVPWQVFWSFYGTIFQEIPFLSIRLYLLISSEGGMHGLIFPLKNALGIALNVYDIYSKCKEEKDKPGKPKEVKEKWETVQLGFNLFCPLAVLFAHLGVLIWRVISVRDTKFAGLVLLLMPFVGVALVRLWQLVQKIKGLDQVIAQKLAALNPPNQVQKDNFELKQTPKPTDQVLPQSQDDEDSTPAPQPTRFESWFQRLTLVIYVIVAFTLDVLLIQGLRDTDESFSYIKPKLSPCEGEYGMTETPTKNTVIVTDNLSYLVIQLSFPLVVFARAWMPRGELSFTRYASLLALDLTIAFDIVEFGKVLVDMLTDPKVSDETDDNILTAFFVFMLAGMLLLATMEGGLDLEPETEAEKKSVLRKKAVWTALLVLCLDAPFFIIRVYVMTQFKVDIDDMELIFLLKNILFIVFGTYRVITLLRDTCKPPNADSNLPPAAGDQSNDTGSAKYLAPGGITGANTATELEKPDGMSSPFVASNAAALLNSQANQDTSDSNQQKLDNALYIPMEASA
jgi:hypothetical protein